MTLDELIQNINTSSQNRYLFHFTDSRNLVNIRKEGGILSLTEARRRGFTIPYPGGNALSHKLDADDGLDSFVHLCFFPQHEMHYVCTQDGRIKDTTWLRIRPEVFSLPGVEITLDIANKKHVERHAAQVGISKLDIEVIYTRTKWSLPEIQVRLRAARRCEVLIPNILPLEHIINPNG